MARAKRLDVALIGFRPQESSPELKHTLDLYGVPYIVCASASKQDHLNYEKVFSSQAVPVDLKRCKLQSKLAPLPIAPGERLIGGLDVVLCPP
jgi:hypothetical protein